MDGFDPLTLITILTAVTLNIIANVTQKPCNVVLRMMKLLLHAATGKDLSSISNIPDDIRTARRRLDLDPVTTTYATCTCGKIYAPIPPTPPIRPSTPTIYPTNCTCGLKITKLAHSKGICIAVPKRPYIMQSFTDFCARLYSRPGVEELIRRQVSQNAIG